MTQMQVDYYKALEQERANKAKEAYESEKAHQQTELFKSQTNLNKLQIVPTLIGGLSSTARSIPIAGKGLQAAEKLMGGMGSGASDTIAGAGALYNLIANLAAFM